MKKTKKTKVSTGRTTATAATNIAANKPAAVRTGTDAPVTGTPDFKAGKDL